MGDIYSELFGLILAGMLLYSFHNRFLLEMGKEVCKFAILLRLQ